MSRKISRNYDSSAISSELVQSVVVVRSTNSSFCGKILHIIKDNYSAPVHLFFKLIQEHPGQIGKDARTNFYLWPQVGMYVDPSIAEWSFAIPPSDKLLACPTPKLVGKGKLILLKTSHWTEYGTLWVIRVHTNTFFSVFITEITLMERKQFLRTLERVPAYCAHISHVKWLL